MAILTPPTTPSFSGARFTLRPNSKVGIDESALDGSVQTLEFPGSVWTFSGSIGRMGRAEAAAWKSFFVQTRGIAGRFYMGEPAMGTPLGTALGTPLVQGASQVGTTLITDGWTPTQSGALLPGDYFQVGTELKMVVAATVVNGAGVGTITFEPPLRAAPADNAPIIKSNPVCIMRLESNNQMGWDVEPPLFYAVGLAAVESFV